MERFPVLDMILRFGKPVAVILALLGGALAGFLAWGPLGWIAIVLGLVVAGLIFVIAKSYIELITLITEMLVPR